MPRFTVRFVLPVLLVAAVMKPARADEPGMIDAAPTVPLAAAAPAPVWYGGQVLAADGALAALTVGCLAVDGGNACALPSLGFFLSGPVVHTTHDGGWRGLASLGMRLGLSAVGIAIAATSTDCLPRTSDAFSDLCRAEERAIGALGGLVVAMAIDSIWAFEDAAPAPSPTPARRASWAVTPTLKVSDNSAGFGLAGRF